MQKKCIITKVKSSLCGSVFRRRKTDQSAKSKIYRKNESYNQLDEALSK